MFNIKFKFSKLIFICLLALILSDHCAAQILSKKDIRFEKLHKSLANTLKGFERNDFSFFGSLNLSKQSINDNGITAPINYLYNTVNNNVFKAGYIAGIRMDGMCNKKNLYTLSVALNQISAGSFYQNKHTLSPFLDEFTHFKADNSFTTISIAAYYKKLLPFNELKKSKIYLIAGPSLDYKISAISNAHSVSGASNRVFVNGVIGTEFDNNGYYLLFAHYKLGTNLFQSNALLQLNRFEIGMSFKVKDLF